MKSTRSSQTYLRRRLQLITLEDRSVPAVFTVTTTADEGIGSLRQAMLDAEFTAGHDTITFQIGSGPQTINVATLLPVLRDAVTIDGTSQPGYSGTPLIEVSGGQIEYGTGFLLYGSNSTIQGLVINGFQNQGIYILEGGNHRIIGNRIGTDQAGLQAVGNGYGIVIENSKNNQIGGPRAADRNLISGNMASAVYIYGPDAVENLVQGNWIGTTANGRAGIPGDKIVTVGVTIADQASNNTIGGATADLGNVIAAVGHGIVLTGSSNNTVANNLIGTDITGSVALGNMLHAVRIGNGASNNVIGLPNDGGNVLAGAEREGVYIENANTTNNTLQGNFIGVGIDGITPLPNWMGIHVGLGATNTLIGGSEAGAGNVISGNRWLGVYLSNAYDIPSTGTKVMGNFIGLGADGITAIPNQATGIGIWHSLNNQIGGTQPNEGNRIAHNLGDGIYVGGDTATGNTMVGNIIGNNRGLPIDVGLDGLSTNDEADTDAGPNQRMNVPIITGAVPGSRAVLSGYLNSVPEQDYRIDFYAQTSHVSGPARYLGSTTTHTDELGVAKFSATLIKSLAANEWVSATATDAEGNTSELSLPQRAHKTIRALSAALSDGVFNYEHTYITGDGVRTVPLTGVLRGDQVTITAKVLAGPGGPDTGIRVSYPGGTFEGDANGETITYIATQDGGTVRYELYGWDSNDYAQIYITARRPNLAAIAPTRNSDGSIRYGSRVTSSFNVSPRGQFIGVDLWYASLDVEGRFVLLDRVVPTRSISLTANSQMVYDIPFDELPARPPTATHILSHVNPDKLIPELQRADNVAATPITLLLPNLSIQRPTRRDDGGINFGFNVTGAPATAKKANVELYYAKGATLNDLLVKLHGQDGAVASATVPWAGTASKRLLVAPPADATHLIAVVDREGRFPETNEDDNLVAIRLSDFLPNYLPIATDLLDNGDVKFTYRVSGAKTPTQSKPDVGVFWATGNTVADIISPTPYPNATPFGSLALNKAQRDYNVLIKASKLLKAPRNATHLLVITDCRDESDEASEQDNVRAIPFRALTPYQGNLTIYRPWSTGLTQKTVPEDDENTIGAGIRINGDDDNQNSVRDGNELDTPFIAGPAEDDLIRLDLKTNLLVGEGLDLVLRQSENALRLWNRRDKYYPVMTTTEQVIKQFGDKSLTYWVEWPGTQHGSVRLQLLVRDRTTGEERILDTIRLVTYRSSVIIFTGEGQNLRGSNMTLKVGEKLHADGYDVHVFLPNEGIGRLLSNNRAWKEVESALSRGVTNFVMMGHSKGGGAVNDLAFALADFMPVPGSYNLALTVTLDSIVNVPFTDRSADTRYPSNSAFALNMYQQRGGVSVISRVLRGARVDGAKNIIVTDKPWGKDIDHQSIDDSPNVHTLIYDALATHLTVR